MTFLHCIPTAESISNEIYDRCSNELDLKDNSIDLVRYSLDQIEKNFDLEREKLAVIVVSTTGEGEPPDNALKFWRRIRKKTLANDHLSHLKYALLGLGDSNYNRFANFGRDLDNRLEALSAKRIIPTGFGDDAIGLEIGVEPWIHSLLLDLPSVLGISVLQQIPTVMSILQHSSSTGQEPSLVVSSPSLASLTELSLPSVSSRFKDIKVDFSESVTDKDESSLSCLSSYPKLPVMESDLFTAEIINIRELTQESTGDDSDEKIILEAEISSLDSVLPLFSPGDSFGFIPGNADEEVNEILNALSLTDNADKICHMTLPSIINHIPKEITLRNLIKYFLELRTVPKKSFLRHLADYTSDVGEKRRLLELSSKEGAEDYASFIRSGSINIMDILRVFPSCKPTLEALILSLPCFVPRYYSVVNFVKDKNMDNDVTLKIVFSVTRTASCHERSGSQSFGIFTGLLYQSFLKQSKKDQKIEDAISSLDIRDKQPLVMKAFKRKNPHFLLNDLSAPLIMVGPGTGVAPFLGFLEKRSHAIKTQELKKPCDSWLFFGCRSQREFIYEKELKDFHEKKILNHLEVCFSRQEVQGDEDNTASKTKYVQDLIKLHKEDICNLLQNPKTMIYVCGDLKSMSIDVFNTFVSILEDVGRAMHENAVGQMKDMQKDKRYLQDIWT